MTYYLRCEHCANYNPVKTQYLTFCDRCGKKLVNNYRDWSNNGQKSLEDFYQQICTTDEGILAVSKPIKPKKSRLSKAQILAIVVMVIVSTLASTLVKRAFHYIMNEKTISDIENATWERNSYGTLGLSIETPKKLEENDMTTSIPENVKPFLEKMESYKYTFGETFEIIAIANKYKPTVQTSLEGAADGAMNGVKARPEISDLKYSQQELNVSGNRGITQKGTYKYKGTIDVEFRDVMTAKNTTAWTVMVVYQANDDVGRKAAERIINSFQVLQ